jgi:tripartite-type tricarboxylate transporter receptor subunit TctC
MRTAAHRLLSSLIIAAVGLGAAPWAAAQGDWPSRPIKLIVPFPAGGTSDNLGRLVAEKLSAALQTPVIVDNKPGGTTQVGTEQAFRAPPDGYTVLLGAGTGFTVLPNLRRNLPYDAKDGFEYLGGVAEYLAVVSVRKDLGVKTLPELIKLAKSQPGKLSYGSAGLASFGHVASEMILRETGTTMLHVPYKGSADAANALAAGQVDLLIDGATVPLAKAGRVVALAAFGAVRHPELPQVPSLNETGIEVKRPTAPGWGLFTPKGTPAAINAKLSKALENMLAEPETQARLKRISTVADWRTPSELRKVIEEDRRFYAELLPAIGIRPED